MAEYVYQPNLTSGDYASSVVLLEERISNPIRAGWVDHADLRVVERVADGLQACGIAVNPCSIPLAEYRDYLERAGYSSRYRQYYSGNLPEKSLEHFLCARLLGLSSKDTFLDIASEGSPLPEIASRLFKCVAHAQDIMYPSGIHGSQIGGDACAMPVPAGFASAAALTCSFEHFEGDADIRLFAELARVIGPRGRVAIVPLYLFTDPAAMTDPRYSCNVDVPFDAGATVYCAEGWGNRHGRFYSPETLQERILRPFEPLFGFSVCRLAGFDAIQGNIYARWALVAERRV